MHSAAEAPVPAVHEPNPTSVDAMLSTAIVYGRRSQLALSTKLSKDLSQSRSISLLHVTLQTSDEAILSRCRKGEQMLFPKVRHILLSIKHAPSGNAGD